MSSGVTGPPACVAAQVDHSDWGGGYGVHGARPAALHVGAPPRVRAQCGRVGPLRRHCGRVHARCEGMQRPPSLTVTLSARSCPPPLRAAVAPDAPGTPWLVHRSPYTLEVAWSLGHDHGEPPQEHEVAWRVTEAGHGMVEDCSDATVAAEPAQGSTPGPWRLERVLAPATACTLSSLLPATGVECRVRSCNRIGWSPFGPASDTFRCDGAAAAIAPACPPPPLTPLCADKAEVAHVCPTSAEVRWLQPILAQGDTVEAFVVECMAVGGAAVDADEREARAAWRDGRPGPYSGEESPVPAPHLPEAPVLDSEAWCTACAELGPEARSAGVRGLVPGSRYRFRVRVRAAHAGWLSEDKTAPSDAVATPGGLCSGVVVPPSPTSHSSPACSCPSPRTVAAAPGGPRPAPAGRWVGLYR